MARSATRRQFLKTSAIASTSLFAAPAILRAKNVNEKLNVACIGVGGRGGAHLPALADENVTAICDVFEPTLGKVSEKYPQAKKFTDFRKLLDHDHDFDAVVVSTCEHTHAFATYPGAAAREARLLREAADSQHLGGAANS